MIIFSRGQLAMLAAAGLLAGCSAQQCDPGKADFFSGVGCAAGGGYQARTAAYSAQLSQAQQQLQASHDDMVRAQANQQASQDELAELRGEAAAMDADRAALEHQLATLRRERRADAASIGRANAALAAANAAASAAQSQPSPQALQNLKQKQQALHDIVSAM